MDYLLPYTIFDLLPSSVTFQFENLVDIDSSKEYESVDSNDNFSDDFLEDDNELDNTEEVNSIINRLLAATVTSFEQKGHPAIYTGNST